MDLASTARAVGIQAGIGWQILSTIDSSMNQQHRLQSVFSPRSVAIIGASPSRGSPRNTILRVLTKHGFGGRIYPVNPTHQLVEGLPAFKSVADLPEVPDVALVITPAQTVPGIIEDCGRKGIRNAIIFSAGFEETEEGKDLAVQLAVAARAHGVTVIGPNCQGVWSVRNKSLLTYSPAAMSLDRVEHAPIAVVSQSGALGGSISNALHRSGLGCSYIISVGNETTFDALDALCCVIEQDDVRVVAMYIEGLKQADRILAIAARARERGVRLLVLKAGRSAVGQQTTASHTGKMASSHSVYQDVLDQAGIVVVDSLREMLAAVEVLAFMPYPRSSGDPKGGVSMLSTSGGAAALLADHSSERLVPLSEFSAATVDRLETLLPSFARKANPIDLTGQINTVAHLFRDTLRVVSADPRSECVVVQYASSGRRFLQEDAEVLKEAARELPVIVSFVGDPLDPDTRRTFRDAGVLLAYDPAATMDALGMLYRLREYQQLAPLPCRAPLEPRPAPRSWDEMMKFCDDGGVTPAKWVVLRPSDRAAAAGAALQYPVVVKVLPSESEHKTELGLVRLRVQTPADVDRIAAEFRVKLGRPEAGILVQEMAQDGVEVVLSCLRNTDFGPVMSIGMGGVAIELFRDVAHLALPVTAEQVEKAMRGLKVWTLLSGFRGKPPADTEALVAAAVRIGDQFLAAESVTEFELNPIIVGAKGQGLRAVDALVVAR